MNINPTARISFGARLDRVNPRGIHIDAETYVASGALIFTHDFSRRIHSDTYIGRKCFIGANSIIMPGIIIGDECIIGAGAVVTKNIESNTIVAGNPAKIIRTNIHTGKYGYIEN